MKKKIAVGITAAVIVAGLWVIRKNCFCEE